MPAEQHCWPIRIEMIPTSALPRGFIVNKFRFHRAQGGRGAAEAPNIAVNCRREALPFPRKNKWELRAACLVGGQGSTDAMTHRLLENQNPQDLTAGFNCTALQSTKQSGRVEAAPEQA